MTSTAPGGPVPSGSAPIGPLPSGAVPTPEAQQAAPAWRRILAQGLFETRTVLRNGEQLLVTVILPLLVLIGLAATEIVSIDTGGATRINAVTPGVLALAVMAGAFTSQAIATAFDRRYGVLRMLATTPLGRSGLVAGKVVAVLVVVVIQMIVLAVAGWLLGWRPAAAGLAVAVLAILLGAACFTALALTLAGTLRAEGVLAVANLLLVLLALAGVIVPVSELPGPLAAVAPWLPSGALAEALRAALLHGTTAWGDLGVLAAWTAASSWAAARWFRWS